MVLDCLPGCGFGRPHDTHQRRSRRKRPSKTPYFEFLSSRLRFRSYERECAEKALVRPDLMAPLRVQPPDIAIGDNRSVGRAPSPASPPGPAAKPVVDLLC